MRVAAGRTLVLPPEQPMYLLNKQGRQHGFGDFFPLEDLPIDMISMETFLRRQEKLGLLPAVLRGVDQHAMDTRGETRRQVRT